MANVVKQPQLTLIQDETLRVNWLPLLWISRKITFLLVAASLLTTYALAKDDHAQTGKLEGTVFVGDISAKSYVAGAKVVVSGPVLAETETNVDGYYAFDALPPGSYSVEASFSEMKAVQTIQVGANQLAQVLLQLKIPEVNTSVNVTANVEEDAKVPSETTTINEKIVQNAPNLNEQFEGLLPLVPGVVRGPDGHINLKGARTTQSGALVNSANVTDPATGAPAISLPIDVVSSVKVISNPYDPEYGKLTGAVSTVDTKTGDYEGYRFSIQNILPRPRERGGSIMGIGAFTPRMTFTGPLVKDRIAITQSFEYRFVETPVNSLPPAERDTRLESVNTYTQLDINVSPKQTATISWDLYPQKLGYMGLNTFTPQPSTTDFHQRGFQFYAQDRYMVGDNNALVSTFSFKRYNVDTTPEGAGPYQLLINTTEGGFFNSQSRRSYRADWQETYEFARKQFMGSHQFKVGLDYSYSDFNGTEAFRPVELIGSSGAAIERMTFTQPNSFSTHQNEFAWWAGDTWSPSQRLTLTLGLRADTDSVTSSTHAAPRAGFLLALTKDGKTYLKGGAGIFYDKVPLMFPVFDSLPDRTVSLLGLNGQTLTSTSYVNRILGGLQNPRSTSWNVALERRVTEHFNLRVGYEQRETAKDFIVSPTAAGILALSNSGSDSYKEVQVVGRYQMPRFTVNASYTHSRAYGDLNDPFLFFGNYPQAVIQPNSQGRLSFDAPNRVLFWGDIQGPWKFTLMPVYDIHTGFPWSIENQYREYLGPRNTQRFPQFQSFDLQVSRPISVPFRERHIKARAGFGVFNVFNHDNPRDVQNIVNSSEYRGFFNDAWRDFRGKLVFQF